MFTLAQFARHVGEAAKVVLRLPQEGRRRLQGAIVRIEGNNIVFQSTMPRCVAFENVDKGEDHAPTGWRWVSRRSPRKPGR